GTNRQMALLAGAAALAGAGYLAGGKEHGAEYGQMGLAAGAAGGQFLNMGFTRGDESQADQMGFDFYYRAGWDPRHFGDLFQRMVDLGYDKTPAIASDHPTLKSRVDAANKRAKSLEQRGVADKYRKPNVATPEEYRRYQQQAVESAKGMP